jgi:sugar (pentulose or hexulose) kinase
MKTAKTRIFIGLDIGTSSIKGAALSADGEILAQTKVENRLLRPLPGCVEFDAEAHLAGALRAVKNLTSALPNDCAPEAVAAGGAGGCSIILDKNDRPLMSAISWMDSRAAENPPKDLAVITPEESHRICGWPFRNWFPLAHLAWIKENEPEIFGRAARFCVDIDHFNHFLCGEWGLDYSQATPTFLFNQTTLDWHEPHLRAAGVARGMLSRLAPPGSFLGRVTAGAAEMTGLTAGTKVFLGAFDHPCAAIGAGVLDPGQMLISTGTSWVGFAPVKSRDSAIGQGLLVDPFMSESGGCRGAIFSVPKIGPVIDELLGVYAETHNPGGKLSKFDFASQAAESSPPGANGLFVSLSNPAAAKERVKDKFFARAVMESAAYALRRKMESYKFDGGQANSAVMSGGPSQSRVWAQITADITGVPLTVSSGQTSGAVGAALFAAAGAGAFKNIREASSAVKMPFRKIIPDPGLKKYYDEKYAQLVKEDLI